MLIEIEPIEPGQAKKFFFLIEDFRRPTKISIPLESKAWHSVVLDFLARDFFRMSDFEWFFMGPKGIHLLDHKVIDLLTIEELKPSLTSALEPSFLASVFLVEITFEKEIERVRELYQNIPILVLWLYEGFEEPEDGIYRLYFSFSRAPYPLGTYLDIPSSVLKVLGLSKDHLNGKVSYEGVQAWVMMGLTLGFTTKPENQSLLYHALLHVAVIEPPEDL